MHAFAAGMTAGILAGLTAYIGLTRSELDLDGWRNPANPEVARAALAWWSIAASALGIGWLFTRPLPTVRPWLAASAVMAVAGLAVVGHMGAVAIRVPFATGLMAFGLAFAMAALGATIASRRP